jgi:hypothetical protein
MVMMVVSHVSFLLPVFMMVFVLPFYPPVLSSVVMISKCLAGHKQETIEYENSRNRKHERP